MKFTSSSTTRRSRAIAPSLSAGSPQMPGPVIRMAPKPRRLTAMSPSVNCPAAAAEGALIAIAADSTPTRRAYTARSSAQHGGLFDLAGKGLGCVAERLTHPLANLPRVVLAVVLDAAQVHIEA